MINLNVEPVFNYGLEIGLIKDPDFLDKVYDEIKIREENKNINPVENNNIE